jgi:hypothetical protein
MGNILGIYSLILDNACFCCEISCDFATDLATCNYFSLFRCEFIEKVTNAIGQAIEDKLDAIFCACFRKWWIRHPKARCVYECFCGKVLNFIKFFSTILFVPQ